MNRVEQRIILNQTDRKIQPYVSLASLPPIEKGWVYNIRHALNMSLQQLGKKLGVSPQAVKAMEQREEEGAITLNSLKQIAEALNMKLVYGLVPNDGSLEKLVEKRAAEIAKSIVHRTSQSMMLEDQEVSYGKIQESVENRTNKLKAEIPKFLWD
jgi:predicted DNA-binding mobile mystery protein A